MTKYKYNVEYSSSFKKNLKKIIKQGKDIDKMLDIIDKLAFKEPLEIKHKDHNLVNDKYFDDCRDVISSQTGYLFINILTRNLSFY